MQHFPMDNFLQGKDQTLQNLVARKQRIWDVKRN